MPTRRAQHRVRATARPPAPTAHRLLNSHTFTLIASWRGQLIICTVVLVLGAIYFVVREPVRNWRQRQRERISRAITDELLAESQSSKDPQVTTASDSTAISTALAAKEKKARERGREKRKEKKKSRCERSMSDNAQATVTSSSQASQETSQQTTSIDSSPSLPPVTTALEPVPPIEPPKAPTLTVDLDSPPAPPTVDLPADTSVPSTPAMSVHSPLVSPPPLLSPVERSPDIDLSSDLDADRPDSSLSRPTYSRSTSTSYSIYPDDLHLPLPDAKKKKRKGKSKARSGSGHYRSDLGGAAMARNFSDDVPSPGSSATRSHTPPTAPGSPRRRRRISLPGITMTPALELLLNNHERTIDALRAEIGQSKAEESKARDEEMRARDELRRSRATEDRIRNDYDRTRKARDRAESDSRRLEAEVLHMRGRFDALTHMYHAVCTRLRDLEMAHGHDPQLPSPAIPPMPSPSMGSGTPMMAYPSPMASPMGFVHYGQNLYPATPHHRGYANFVISPSAHRRGEGGSGQNDALAGPLTPGAGATPSISQSSSPYPSDLSLNPATATPSSATCASDLSAAELRRINIASSVLKRKNTTEQSESGDSAPNSKDSDPSSDTAAPVEGLGIKSISKVQSTFPSARPAISKQSSTSSISSGTSSAPTGGRLMTPSSTGAPPRPLTQINGTYVAEPDIVNGHTDDTKSEYDDHSHTNGDDYAPLFASLAHTPEQLEEIARIRQEAIRERERRGRTRSNTAPIDL